MLQDFCLLYFFFIDNPSELFMFEWSLYFVVYNLLSLEVLPFVDRWRQLLLIGLRKGTKVGMLWYYIKCKCMCDETWFTLDMFDKGTNLFLLLLPVRFSYLWDCNAPMYDSLSQSIHNRLEMCDPQIFTYKK